MVVGLKSPITLRKHFRKQLDTGADEAKAKAVETLFKMAISGKCIAATLFWAKARMYWREPTREEFRKFHPTSTEVTVRFVNPLGGDAHVDQSSDQKRVREEVDGTSSFYGN